jgi:hypothetical protein
VCAGRSEIGLDAGLGPRHEELAGRFGVSRYWTTANLPSETYDAVGIRGASAGLAPAIQHYAAGRVHPGPLAQVVVGLDRAAQALGGELDPGAGTKIHIDPRL